jgi:hypothetical protein
MPPSLSKNCMELSATVTGKGSSRILDNRLDDLSPMGAAGVAFGPPFLQQKVV